MSAAPATVLPTLVIPTKSRPDAASQYPSSPLKVFPPPAPSLRRPLRERCGVSLTLHIETPALAFKPSKVPGPWSPKGHLQPHRNHLPRRRNPKPCFASFQEKPQTPPAALPEPPRQKKSASVPTPAPAPHPVPTPTYALKLPKVGEPRLQAIIPALWVAFAGVDDRSYEEGFSHIVEICYGGDATAQKPGSSERIWSGHAQRLRLALPESARHVTGRAALALGDAQLRAARDFIAECLPKSLASMPEQSEVRVLVVAPQGRPTDAMCLVGCYLAFVANQATDAILRCIDEEETILSVWKGEVSGDEMDRVEKIARSWSWLSTLAKR
ncbi:hypothetical protein BV20DRAFT_781957 [Pilatotrama ljubarskyi]|nr:hypothetical protein BV20DRAFT_781957 [Pilatotrama ljubarskyi]